MERAFLIAADRVGRMDPEDIDYDLRRAGFSGARFFDVLHTTYRSGVVRSGDAGAPVVHIARAADGVVVWVRTPEDAVWVARRVDYE